MTPRRSTPWLALLALALVGCSGQPPAVPQPEPADAGIDDAPTDDLAECPTLALDVGVPVLDVAPEVSADLPCPVTCDDQNPCTVDTCKQGKCMHALASAPCNDDNLCTTDDHCTGGKCGPGATLDCDDGQPCTTDTCSPATGCSHALDVTDVHKPRKPLPPRRPTIMPCRE